jgi:hypothetical protein
VSSPSKDRRKKDDKKRRKREAEKRKRRAHLQESRSDAGRMRRAALWPLREARINRDFRETGMAQVLVAREAFGRIAFALFLVDLRCLGVKDCFARDGQDAEGYDEMLTALTGEREMEPCDPAFAAKVVLEGAAYAAGLGFRPEAGFGVARELLGGIDPAAASEEVPLGHAGKPMYVAGPNDDVARILSRLEERLGPGGFHYVVPGGDAPEEWPGEDEPDPAERAWGRLRRAEGVVVGAVHRFALARRGRRFFEDAYEAFGGFRPGSDTRDRNAASGFLPWSLFAFSWTSPRKQRSSADRRSGPVAVEFLAEHGAELDELEHRLLLELVRRPFSFHAVTAAEPGRSIALRDLLTGREVVVRERLASGVATPGDVMYARAVTLDGVSILVGLEPFLLPASLQNAIIDLRESHAGEGGFLDDEEVGALDDSLRASYRSWEAELRNPRPPALQNTDGDPLAFHTLTYDLSCSPDEAFRALAPLAVGEDPEEMRGDGEMDGDGALVSIEFPWLRLGNAQNAGWENTVLGHIELELGLLTISVNSEKRAERIQSEVGRRLGERALPRSFEREAWRDALRPKPRRSGAAPESPEVRAELERMRDAQWRAWPDQPIPALGGRTPRAAARTESGRERLEALLLDFASSPPNPMSPDVDALRRELGLEPRRSRI